MTARLLRQKYVRQFASFEPLSAAVAWGYVMFYVLIIVFCLVFGYILLKGPVSLGDLALLAAFALLVATRLRGLNNIVHECSHSTFCKGRKQNVLIGRVCASLTLSCFKKYRDEHLSHHAHLGDNELDRDFRKIKNLGLDEELNRSTIIRHIITPILGRHLQYYVSIDLSDDDGALFKWLRVSLLFTAVLITAIEPVYGTLLILTPYLFLYSALNYWADCMDHAGLISSEDEIDASRNILVPRVVRWIFFPRNDSFHLVHHLFPTIPAVHLEISHDILTREPLYAARGNAVGHEGTSTTAVPQES